MQLSEIDGVIEMKLSAKEFESLAVFMANFNDDEVNQLIGHDCGSRVNKIANEIAPMIISSKEIE